MALPNDYVRDFAARRGDDNVLKKKVNLKKNNKIYIKRYLNGEPGRGKPRPARVPKITSEAE